MLETLLNYFLNPPGRLINLGARLFHVGSALTILGVIGRVSTTVGSVTSAMAGHKDSVVSLAAMYPGLPTWWVPEGVVGFTCSLLLAASGFSLARWGKQFKRVYGLRT